MISPPAHVTGSTRGSSSPSAGRNTSPQTDRAASNRPQPTSPSAHRTSPEDQLTLSRDAADDDERDTRGSELGARIAAMSQGNQTAAERGQDVREANSSIREQAMSAVRTAMSHMLSTRSEQPHTTSPVLSSSASAPAPASEGVLSQGASPHAGDSSSAGQLGSLGPQLDRWDDTIVAEASKWGVPPERIKAMMAIESGGDPSALQRNPTYGDTAGLMQINATIWGDEARRLGYDLNTPEGQIGMASWMLKQGYNERGSWDGATSWYFNPSGTGDSVNGTTNAQYINRVHELEAEMTGNLS